MSFLLQPLVLENGFVRLEPLEERHRGPLAEAGADPGLWAFAALNQHGRDFAEWFDDRLAAPARGELTFAVFDRGRQAYVGSSSYLAVVPAHRRLEIGWTWYRREVWAGLVNPSCKLLLMGHAFDRLGCLRVELKCDARNTRSWKAMERFGAVHEGVHRRHMVLPDGHLRDTAWFSVIAEEWPAVKAGLVRRLAAAAMAHR